jgi:hypothetical protein
MLNPYLLGGVGLILAGSLTFAGCEHLRAKAAVAGEAKAVSERNHAIGANSSNLTTIADLKAALAEWEAIGKPVVEVKELLATLDERTAELNGARNELRKHRQAAATLPECQSLLRTTFAACPGIDLGLRSISSCYENRNGASACAGPEGSATGAD